MEVYLDYASTTPVDNEVLEKMLPYFSAKFGNPSSMHSFGRQADLAVLKARTQVKKAIGAENEKEIYFTSCGSESNSWALRGIAVPKSHIIVSSIEHHSVLDTAKQLEKDGVEVTYLKVDYNGLVNADTLKKALKSNTILVSIMTANNEIGTIQPIEELTAAVKEYNSDILFHTDAVQAVGSIAVNVSKTNVDMLSLSGHKFYAPKGVGALYIKNGVKIKKLIGGGNQERRLRGGTLNVPYIVGLGAAIEKAEKERESKSLEIRKLRDYFIDRVLNEIPHASLNGHQTLRLDNNAHFTFLYAENDAILTQLDLSGIAVSIGSACAAGSKEPSHVLKAIGLPEELLNYTVRFSLGKYTTKKEIDYTITKLKAAVLKTREVSPLFVNIRQDPKMG